MNVETQIGKRVMELRWSNYELIEKSASGLHSHIDRYIVEGLKRKGYEFTNAIELYKFAAEHCECVDRFDIKEKTYTVKGVPFLVHRYKNMMIDTKILTLSDGSIKATLSLGEFVYV